MREDPSIGPAKNRRIGVFGGSFNPPHYGHLVIAEMAREQLALDQVLFVPTLRPPHKQLENDPGAAQRFELCELALKDAHPAMVVSDLELRREGDSYTAHTLIQIADQNWGSEIFLILGGDQAAKLGSWYRPEKVLELASIAVSGRGNEDFERARNAVVGLAQPERILQLDTPLIGTSSTLIRQRIGEGQTVRHLLPEQVRRRIEDAGYYRVGDVSA